jgi:hypothetical protein
MSELCYDLRMITQEYIKEILSYNPETGVFTRKVRTSSSVKIGDVAGCLSYDGIYISVCNKLHKAHRLVWLYVYGDWPPLGIDHINGNPSDNRICNLRLATDEQNGRNRGKNKNNITGFKGVSWHKQVGKFAAQIHHKRRKIHLGLFTTAEAAHAAYCEAAAKYHGEFSRTE